VLEGPVDVLAVAARARAANQAQLLPVAACGTAFTTAHGRRIRELVPEQAPVVIAFDGDAAGRAAALRAGEQARAAGLDARIAVLPSGVDPADYLARTDSTLDTFTDAQAVPLLTMQVHDAIAAQGERMQWIEGCHAAARTIAARLATYPVTHAAHQIGWIANVLSMDAATFTLQLLDAFRPTDDTKRHVRETTRRDREIAF
jgi:DNA primase